MQDLITKPGPGPAADAIPSDGRGSSLLSLMVRIEDCIETETASLRADPRFDIKASNARKGRHLHELTKALKGMKESDLDPEHRAAMTRLRAKLAINEATIRAHLSAVGEIASLLQNVIERAQADGTYSMHEFGQR
ncbi:hypothetical protein [Chelativorans sp. AA-79]|uniref:hypothetical protein n=1 Tax=Chelativorans sp. AA-79 TaxID=3028735 RepID=UPI0023F6FA9F|nr:hypothetical protein [Chelativorans sp. AA-79]WEX08334.1 hypothetical protein PVE73_19975 [Chelativorans sp. AA-79]